MKIKSSAMVAIFAAYCSVNFTHSVAQTKAYHQEILLLVGRNHTAAIVCNQSVILNVVYRTCVSLVYLYVLNRFISKKKLIVGYSLLFNSSSSIERNNYLTPPGYPLWDLSTNL